MFFLKRLFLKKELNKNNISISKKALKKKHAFSLEESSSTGSIGFVGDDSHRFAIGCYSYWRSGSCIGSITIGRFCSISTDVIIGLEKNGHPLSWLSTSPFQYSQNQITRKRIKKKLSYQPMMSNTAINHDVWIGNRVIIYNGCSVGVGAVVAAGSIVTKDVPPYAIVAGVPARIIGYRFEDSVIKQLTTSTWWNFPVEILADIDFDDQDQFLMALAVKHKEMASYKRIEFQNMRYIVE